MIRPIELSANQPRQFYRGGQAISELRGQPNEDVFRPEDWIASTTPRFGMGQDGLSKLPDGRYLRDVIEADPESWLGPEHAHYFGASPALLVKLLDAGERLPVHLHPTRSFAYRHLGSRHGKTEAWVVLGAQGTDPAVYLGWKRDIEAAEILSWVRDQDTQAMLENLHKLFVSPGDAVLVPAGTPHAIGRGVFSIELQEPTDFSIMLEFAGFDLDPGGGELGLGRELALSCVRGKAFSSHELDLLRRRSTTPPASAPTRSGAADDILPAAANPYFRAQRVRGADGARLEASFAVVIGLAGEGSLVGDGWRVPLRRGSTIVAPWASGPMQAEGQAELIRCLPPLPADAASDEPREP